MHYEDERAKFRRLVAPHYEDAFTTARWLAQSRSDAEDILQEAMIRAFRSIHQCANSNARPWILAIVRNCAYTWLRKNRSTKILLIDDLSEEQWNQVEHDGYLLDENESNPEELLIRRLDEAQLEQAIRQLPQQFQEALVLRDIQGLNYREMAEIIGVPVGTVMSRLARARQRLVQLVQTQSAVASDNR